MRPSVVPIISLLISTFFLMVGAGLSSIVLPVRGSLEGWSIYEIGMLGTGYAIAFTIGCLVAPRIVRQAGHVRAFAALAALLAIMALLHALIVHPIVWVLIRAVTGFGLAGVFMVIESWLNERADNETRGFIFSLYMVVTMGAMMTGQFIMPLSDPALATPFMICAIMFAAAVIPTTMSRQQHPKPLTEVKLHLAALFRLSPAAAVGVVLSGVMEGAWNNMAAVFGKEVGFTTIQIATLLVLTMAGGIVFQYPLGRASDKVDRRLVMAGAALGCALISILAAHAESTYPLTLFVTAFFLGGLIYPLYSVAVAHANDHADSSRFVQVSGGLLILYGLGTMAGPLLAASLMEWHGAHGIFFLLAGCSAAMAAYSFFRIMRRETVPPEDQEDFSTIPLSPTQTPATFALDPRAENEQKDSL